MKRQHVANTAAYAIAITFALLLGLSLELRVSAFGEPDLLTRRIKATAIKGETIDQVLGRLPEYGIPAGIEVGDEKLTPRRQINLDLPETNLKDFLDSVVAKDPRYTWKVEGGVVHLWPVKGRDTLVTSLLDVKVSHFAIIGDSSRYAIFNDIMNLPEIRSQLVIAGVDPLIFLNSGSMRRLGKETTFSETNVTLRELLDKIVVQTEIKQWVIIRWGKNNEYITLRSG